MKFAKPPLSFDQQIDLLLRRGLEIPNRDRARHYLAHINYYRLRAYWVPYEKPVGKDDHGFEEGATFDDVLGLYIFDRQLRLLLLDAIERVEVSLRTRWAYVLAVKHGPHAYRNPSLFRDAATYKHCMDGLKAEIDRSHETFIEHYKKTYDDPPLPPIWAVCEVMSLGQLSRWFDNLKQHADQKEIAAPFGLDAKLLRSFMHHLTHVRNLCAHHNRVWNRRFTFTMRIPRNPSYIVAWFNPPQDRKLYNTLVMLGYLLRVISPDSKWISHVRALISAHPQADPIAMGFPEDWVYLPIWKVET